MIDLDKSRHVHVYMLGMNQDRDTLSDIDGRNYNTNGLNTSAENKCGPLELSQVPSVMN